MKLRTTEQLLATLDDDLAWRRKELSSLRLMAERTKYRPRLLGPILRAGIALLYAHWEGFIKTSSEAYLEFVSRQGLVNSDLADNFLAISARGPLTQMAQSAQQSYALNVVGFFRSQLGLVANISAQGSINTKSNLSSEVTAVQLRTIEKLA
jgi:hypothetical protein